MIEEKEEVKTSNQFAAVKLRRRSDLSRESRKSCNKSFVGWFYFVLSNMYFILTVDHIVRQICIQAFLFETF
jgi:hypothetical protein